MRCFLFVVTVVASGCSLLAPSDDEAMRGTRSAPVPGDGGASRDAGEVDGSAPPATCPAEPASCRDVLACTPAATSGLFDVRGGDSGTRTVYCDMETAGGGWTLIARSVLGATQTVGWFVDQGSPSSDDAPFALDARTLQFSEVLVGSRGAGKSWGADVYRFRVPASFLAQAQSDAIDVSSTLERVAGACEPAIADGLHFAGHTGRPYYFFRDQDRWTDVGLGSGGFRMAVDCSGGNLGGRQGMIFVR